MCPSPPARPGSSCRPSRELYPDVPDHEEIGTHSEKSTYRHLVIDWLELDTLIELLGEVRAREILPSKGP